MKALYRMNFFGYYRDKYDTLDRVIKEAEWELSLMPFQCWVDKRYTIEKWEGLNLVPVEQGEK